MTVEKEFLVDLKEKYEKTENLVIEKSKQDPPTEPYKSHYEAKDILLELSNSIKNYLESIEQPDDLETLQFILAHIYVDLGKVYNFTEEVTTGEKYLNDALDLLKGREAHSTAICAVVSALNESGILWMNRNESEKSKKFLVDAETYYKTFKDSKQEPLDVHDLFENCAKSENGRGEKLLEKLNVLTLFYLAQVFGSLGNLDKSAIYCHTTLKKQLLLSDYESVDWALNAATLSQYFCTNNRYKEARHHLAAATQILLEYQNSMFKPGMTTDEKKATEDNFNHRLADVNRCWTKYALNLMSDSRDRLLMDSDELGVEDLKISNSLLFGSKIDDAYSNIITDRFLLDIDDAKPLFLTALKWMDKAKSYYTADTEASEYSKIIQDQAVAYKHLAFFESDPSNQAKMHKRRIDLLEDLLNMLNRVFYMNIVREVLYELASAYSNILDIKLDAFEQNQNQQNGIVNPNALKKINDLITKSRNYFSDFISTYYQPKTKELKSDLSVDELIPIAFSCFQIARISYKFITPDKQLRYNNLSMCLENYQKFVSMCAKNEQIGEKMRAEVGVSKEMVQLLPLKLDRMKEEIREVRN